MSLIVLAETIDRLVDDGGAFVTEAEATVAVSALSAAAAIDLLAHCQLLGWAADLVDSADNQWPRAEPPDPDFAPFRLIIRKPMAPADTLQLLSNHEFARWLRRGHGASHWHIARLTGTVVTQSRVLQSWGGERLAPTAVPGKSPRALVREFGNQRRVPEDTRPWLAPLLDETLFATPAAQVWVRAATTALVHSLPDEIDPLDGALKFRGPPRLTLPAPATDVSLDVDTFNALQAAAHWVFENEREAEMRHILLAAELARSGAAAENTLRFLSAHLAHAWESAQIAYQMALADTSRDTLKMLVDLRKAVTDETAKLSDLSRQLATSVAGAMATGIGLVAARVAANAPTGLVVAVMAVVVVYVAMVILSGSQFIRLQRRLRAEWRPKLYRFLPVDDYARMVAQPSAQAERSFIWTAVLGGVSVLALAIVCVWPPWVPAPRADRAVPSAVPATPVRPGATTATQPADSKSNDASTPR